MGGFNIFRGRGIFLDFFTQPLNIHPHGCKIPVGVFPDIVVNLIREGWFARPSGQVSQYLVLFCRKGNFFVSLFKNAGIKIKAVGAKAETAALILFLGLP
jgi:hypothetical protein